MRLLAFALSITALLAATPVAAAEDQFEIWFNPTLSFDVDEDTGVEIDTALRFRDSADAADTYFVRLWVHQSVGSGVTVSGAIDYRVNAGGADETRLQQQLSVRRGIWRGRLRTEQRFVEEEDRTGWRIRPRIGVVVPLDREGRWSLATDVEPFFTLQSTSVGGLNGLTALRTQMGVSHDLSDQLSLSLTYLRQQDMRRGAPDRVAHVPLIGIELSL